MSGKRSYEEVTRRKLWSIKCRQYLVFWVTATCPNNGTGVSTTSQRKIAYSAVKVPIVSTSRASSSWRATGQDHIVFHWHSWTFRLGTTFYTSKYNFTKVGSTLLYMDKLTTLWFVVAPIAVAVSDAFHHLAAVQLVGRDVVIIHALGLGVYARKLFTGIIVVPRIVGKFTSAGAAVTPIVPCRTVRGGGQRIRDFNYFPSGAERKL